MKAGSGQHFKQAYNAQVVVDTKGSYLIVGERVTKKPNDKQELVPDVNTIPQNIRKVSTVIGIIKLVMGFRQFLLRGIEKVNIEWSLVTLHVKTVANSELYPGLGNNRH